MGSISDEALLLTSRYLPYGGYYTLAGRKRQQLTTFIPVKGEKNITMTREAFIRKWLGNPEKPYSPENRDEMRDDLDKIIKNSLKPYQKMKKVYEFLYNPSVSESAPLTVSIHESESGAIQAMEAHRQEIFEDWKEEKKHNPGDVDYPWDFDQWWGVRESELLP